MKMLLIVLIVRKILGLMNNTRSKNTDTIRSNAENQQVLHPAEHLLR